MLKFHHCPWSRSSSILWLLEELGEPYEIEIVDVRAPGGAPETYREVQSNKKVPAIEHDGTVITERAAISIYLADAFPRAGLAPAVGDRDRGPYLTALVYCDSVFDPAVAARAHGLTYKSRDYSFGLFDDVIANLERILSRQPYAAGERFTAADTQLASALAFTMGIMKMVPEKPAFADYVDRLSARPAYQRAGAKDAEMAKEVTPLPFAGG
jgi:glutathione S-transferase